jgi:hypothetical protein
MSIPFPTWLCGVTSPPAPDSGWQHSLQHPKPRQSNNPALSGLYLRDAGL